MSTVIHIGQVKALVVIIGIILCSGCAQQRMAPPLFTSSPHQESLDSLDLLKVPNAPASVSMPLIIQIPQQKTSVDATNYVMRHGATVKPGSSVVISVPVSFWQRSQNTAEQGIARNIGFKTDGYFNTLEQYIERGLISIGLNVKDRSKFEAKLRDLRDSGKDDSYVIALADLQKELDAGKITRDMFAEQAKQLRDKLLDAAGSSTVGRKEMIDISEVIRAAQDGDVMADYILQVNALAVEPYTGSPLQLGKLPEVQKFLNEEAGLRIGTSEQVGTIPNAIRQPWAQARFNTKLIDVKTGSIDWIGEYDIESLAVLKKGVQIFIGIRKRPSNTTSIIGGIQNYNANLQVAHLRASESKRHLDSEYRAAMQKASYFGIPSDENSVQARRKTSIKRAEDLYAQHLSAYRNLAQQKPRESTMTWAYHYDVDDAVVIPDLLRPRTEEEGRRLLEHVKALGAKVTHDLLRTINISTGNKVK